MIIHLHGPLAKFGGPYTLDVTNPAEAIRALTCQLSGMREVLVEHSWHLVTGDPESGTQLVEDELCAPHRCNDLHVIPAISGAGNGMGQVIAGIVIIAVAWWNPLGWQAGTALMVGGMGAGIAMGGVVAMSTKMPSASDYGSRDSSEKKSSFLFDGPTNTSTQGVPVPLVYGRVLVGSVVISAGISSEEVK